MRLITLTIFEAKPISVVFFFRDIPCQAYKHSVLQGCRLEDMPPHVYAAGQTAYRTLMSTKKVRVVFIFFIFFIICVKGEQFSIYIV